MRFNLQGDIVGLLDSAGMLAVEYRYDAWGKPLSVTIHESGDAVAKLAKRNPFRYRGYVYDEETGLYYLRSRYYNPEVGRFLNADEADYVEYGMMLNNLFAYCSNVPTVQNDEDGEFGSIALGLTWKIAAFAEAVVTSIVSAPVVAFVAGAVVVCAAIYVAVNAIDAPDALNKPIARVDTAEQTAAKSLSKSQEKVRKEQNRYDYWIAKFVKLGNGVETYMPTYGISYSTAISVVRSGGAVIASSKRNAYRVACAAGCGLSSLRKPERHHNSKTGSRAGYLWHTHMGDRRRKRHHVFYL